MNLRQSFIALWIKPIHAVHHNSDCQGSLGYAANDFIDLICVDSEAIESARAGELRMCFCR